MLTSIYAIGLVIVAISVGHEYKVTYGWATLGIGLMLYSIVTAIVIYLDGRKG